MSYEATIYFKNSGARGHAAPQSVDPKGEFVFGGNFPRLIESMDQSARELGVAEPSQFVWSNQLDDEGELDQLGAEQFAEI